MFSEHCSVSLLSFFVVLHRLSFKYIHISIVTCLFFSSFSFFPRLLCFASVILSGQILFDPIVIRYARFSPLVYIFCVVFQFVSSCFFLASFFSYVPSEFDL